ncbi:MAG: hypothetical protein ACXWCS_04630 [Burkholderiales bacterium]
MRLWELVSRWLFAPRTPSRARYPQLYQLDVDRIARELDLQNEARKLAEARLPSPQQTVITAAEAKAVQRIEKARQDFVEWASFRLGIINEGFARRDVTALVNRALEADKAFQNKAGTRLLESEALLQDLAAKAGMRQRELDEFRTRNSLSRAASYPEGSATFARYALLLALIVCEGAANAYFFSQGLDSGLIGGFIGAAVFAALNLAIAFVLGKFAVPSFNHKEAATKLLGAVAIALAVACMTAVGLTIAHFRDALMAAAAEPAKVAWAGLQAAPFGLRDINSWVLFFVSILFAAFALFDGLSSDDRYPGYGRVDRRAQASRDEYLDELQAVRSEIDELKEEELASLDEDIRKARGIVAELEGLIGDKESARNRLGTALLDAENCLDALMKVFRDQNEIHRGGLARPQYFDSRPTLQKIALPSFHTERDKVTLNEQQQLVERLLARVELLRAGIRATFDALADTLKPDHAQLREAVQRHETK